MAKVADFSYNGLYRLLPHEFKAFRSQARAAGYSVRKCDSRVDIESIIDVDLLLRGLNA